VLGALFGRKMASAGTLGRASTTLNRASRTARQRGDVQRAWTPWQIDADGIAEPLF